MKVALVQTGSPEEETRAERLARVGRLCASAHGSDLLVLPELWLTGYFSFDRYEAEAEPLDGPALAAAVEWARAGGCHVNLGSFLERDREGRMFNTSVLVAPTGRVLSIYRKVHLFSLGSRETELLDAGQEVVSATTSFGQVGTATCYDLRFPELWRGLIEQGAELVVVPAAWPAARLAHWQLFTTCRAVEQQVFVVACNATGLQGDVQLAGRSRVVSPGGEVLAEAGAEEGVTVVDIDMGEVVAARLRMPVLQDRRLPFGSGAVAQSPLTDVPTGREHD